ncbi:MAG: (2Fe-2S)-binding protein [Caldisericaceae bacterium]
MNEEKVIICRCEDVTLADINKAFKDGYTDIESIRRYLKIGTGPCQGKTCIPLLQKILAGLKGSKEIENITSRPPESPVPFGALIERGKDGKL